MKIFNLKNKYNCKVEAKGVEMTKSEKIYKYLSDHAVGYDNRVKSNELMKEFRISDNEMFRSYIQKIRQSDKFDKIICSQAGAVGGYWIAKNSEEVEQTLEHLYNRSMEMLKTYSIIKKKAMLDNQFTYDFIDEDIENIEAILRG